MKNYLYTCPVTQHKYVVEVLQETKTRAKISGVSLSDRSLFTYKWVQRKTVSPEPIRH
jgi:hypothetical protein